MTVRLYGRDVGNGSLAVVTRGFRQVLEGAGLLEGFVALDRSGGSEEDESPAGALARDGVFTGNLNMVSRMIQGARHERHWVTVTPNSTHIPRDLLAEVLKLEKPHILSASRWGTGVIIDTLREMGFEIEAIAGDGTWCDLFFEQKFVKVITVHHGVTGFAPVRDEIERTRTGFERNGEFRVVHFSTTVGQRKSTLELVQAWVMVADDLPPKSKLFLVMDHPARDALVQRMLDIDTVVPNSVQLLPRADMGPELMSKLLCHMHLVATPSRGEGFGMIPASARACGVPVLTTNVTGHSAGHCQGLGVWVMQSSAEMAPIDDGPAAMAPVVKPAWIAQGLRSARSNWSAMSAAAERDAQSFADAWSWERQLAEFMERLR